MKTGKKILPQVINYSMSAQPHRPVWLGKDFYRYCDCTQESVWKGVDSGRQQLGLRKVATGFQRSTTVVT